VDTGPPDVPVQYRSDVDGDRYVIIDDADADMSGWCVEVGPDEAWYRKLGGDGTVPTYHEPRVEQFTKEHYWYRTESGRWDGLGFGTAAYPWSAMVDHSERILRWIPPGSDC
jgi:hypothetical protein